MQKRRVYHRTAASGYMNFPQAVKEMGLQEILIKNLGYLQFICNLTLNLKVI